MKTKSSVVVESVKSMPTATILDTDKYGMLVDFGYVNGAPFRLGRGKCKILLANLNAIKTVANSTPVTKTATKKTELSPEVLALAQALIAGMKK